MNIVSYPWGVSVTVLIFIAVLMVALFYFSILMSNIRVARISPWEVMLLVMFSSSLTLMMGLLIGQQVLYAAVVFFVMLFFAVLLFVKRMHRWMLDREVVNQTRKALYQERKMAEKKEKKGWN